MPTTGVPVHAEPSAQPIFSIDRGGSLVPKSSAMYLLAFASLIAIVPLLHACGLIQGHPWWDSILNGFTGALAMSIWACWLGFGEIAVFEDRLQARTATHTEFRFEGFEGEATLHEAWYGRSLRFRYGIRPQTFFAMYRPMQVRVPLDRIEAADRIALRDALNRALADWRSRRENA